MTISHRFSSAGIFSPRKDGQPQIPARILSSCFSVIDGTGKAKLEQARKMLAKAAEQISRGLGWMPPL